MDPMATPVIQKVEVLTAFIRGYHNFAPAGCGQFHWEDDPAVSEITISASAPIDTKDISASPHIVVTPGAFQDTTTGLGNVAGYRFSDAEVSLSIRSAGHLCVYAVADTALLATMLADQVRVMVYAFQGLLERPGGFQAIGRAGISVNPPSPPGAMVPGDPNSGYMVQVNIPAVWTHEIRSRPSDNPKNLSLAQIIGSMRAREYVPDGLHVVDKIEIKIGSRVYNAYRRPQSVLPDVSDLLRGFHTEYHTSVIPRREG